MSVTPNKGWSGQGPKPMGRFVQGKQYLRTFCQGHIGRGQIAIAPLKDIFITWLHDEGREIA
jgi:hypothetical protein